MRSIIVLSMCQWERRMKSSTFELIYQLKQKTQKQAGHFSQKSVSMNPISASDESHIKWSTAGLRYQIEDSEAERKNQPPKEREKLVLV